LNIKNLNSVVFVFIQTFNVDDVVGLSMASMGEGRGGGFLAEIGIEMLMDERGFQPAHSSPINPQSRPLGPLPAMAPPSPLPLPTAL
jgi:hypothetical protein